MSLITIDLRPALFTAALLAASAPLKAVDSSSTGNAGELTSEDLVAAVLANNPTLPMMRAAWNSARARVERVSALDDSMLSYAVAPLTAEASDLDFGNIVQLSQKLPWPGKRRLKGEAAARDADAAGNSIEGVRLGLAAAAKTLFADWFFVHQAMSINRERQGLLKEIRAIVETRYGTGTASRQEALRADVEYHRERHRTIVLERERRETASHINALLNRAPDAPLPPPEPPVDDFSLPAADRLRAAALRRHPELTAMASKLQGHQARVDLARREYYPDFNVSAGYNSLWARDESRFTVGIGVNLPLDQRKRRAREDEARAAYERARWELSDLEAKVAEGVQVAYDRLQESRHVLELYRQTLLPLAEESLAAAKAEYAAGGGDFLAFLEAEQALLLARIQTQQALADTHRNRAELERAAGGFDSFAAIDNRGGR